MSASGEKPLEHGSENRVLGFGRDRAQGNRPKRDDDTNESRRLPRSPTILEYAPKHVRERFDPRAADEAVPPRPPERDEPPERTDQDDEEQYDAPLVPEAPHDETPRDDKRAEAPWDRDDAMADEPHEADDDAPAASAPRRANDETEFDENLAQLAALLELIRRNNAATEQPSRPLRVDDALPPLGPVRDSELHIDGLRVPRSLQPSYLPPPPPPLPAYGSSPLKIVVGAGAACLAAAAIAYLIVGDWYAPAPHRVAPLLHAQAGERAAANVDPPAAQEAARAPGLASTPTPFEVASAGPAVEAPAAAAPPRPPSLPSTAPRAVTVLRIAPRPTDALGGSAPHVPPAAAALPPAVAPQASLAPPPTPPRAPPAMDAQEIELLLKQGKQFVAVGDLVTARTVLSRVANAGVAAGALALAETYDPTVLAKLGVRGMEGDIEQARRWYARAQELGSDEAPHRLVLMAHPAGNAR